MEKSVNVKAKISLQPLLSIREINFRYLNSYRLAKKVRTKLIEIIKIKIRIHLPKIQLLLILYVSFQRMSLINEIKTNVTKKIVKEAT